MQRRSWATHIDWKWAFGTLDFEQTFGQIVSIRVRTLSNTNLVVQRHIKRGKISLPVDARHSKTLLLKPRANGRNIVGQQLPTLLDVTRCVRLQPPFACCWMLLPKFETSQTFQPTTPKISFVPWSPKRSTTMLDLFAKLFQHCLGRARSLRMVYKDLWVVSFPRYTAGPNIVGSCCIRLHTTPNIVGATMLHWELLRPFARNLKLPKNTLNPYIASTTRVKKVEGEAGECHQNYTTLLSLAQPFIKMKPQDNWRYVFSNRPLWIQELKKHFIMFIPGQIVRKHSLTSSFCRALRHSSVGIPFSSV